MVIKYSGFLVDSFNDPLLALSSFKLGFYTMVIIDIRMPKMNGYESNEEIRKKMIKSGSIP